MNWQALNFSWFILYEYYLIYRSPVKTCKAYIPKRPRFEEPISSSSGSSNGDFDGGYFPSGKSTSSISLEICIDNHVFHIYDSMEFITNFVTGNILFQEEVIEVATTTREPYHHKLSSMKMVLSVLIMISEVQKKFHRKD